ncbi:MAG: hypothetical protein KatS3mg008_1981 [Acidimicrobiales bacterium]|nr:MAG: hypothetical protein KatS3mg008_1981 [Acidimicrobiales bacterium]
MSTRRSDTEDPASRHPTGRGVLGAADALLLAAAAWAGAVASPSALAGVPWSGAAAPLALGVLVRRLSLVSAGMFLLTAAHAARIAAHLAEPLPTVVGGSGIVVGDPEVKVRSWGPASGTAAVVELGGRRWRVEIPGGELLGMAVGDRVHVPRTLAAPLRHRQGDPRVVGLLRPHSVRLVRKAGGWWAVANGLRDRLAAGMRLVPTADRAVLSGLLLGDDRDQDAATQRAFRRSGLSHLLVVSGQNVALVLTALRPLLSGLPRRVRVVCTGLVLALFATVTRFEPSVCRATAMAGVATLGAATGRPLEPLRALGLACTAAIVVDPLVARSVGFAMSVCATAGILLLAAPTERGIRRAASKILPAARMGRRGVTRGVTMRRAIGYLTSTVATSIAAQVAVGPLLVRFPGGVPLAGMFANPIAGPPAAFATVWGGAVCLVGPSLPEQAAEVLHLPTRLAVSSLRHVASAAASAPLGGVGGATFWCLSAVVAGGLVLRAIRRGRIRPGLIRLGRFRLGRIPPPGVVSRPVAGGRVIGGRVAAGRVAGGRVAGLTVLLAGSVTLLVSAAAGWRGPGHVFEEDLVVIPTGVAGRVVVVLHRSTPPERILRTLDQSRVGRVATLFVADPDTNSAATVRQILASRRVDHMFSVGGELPGATRLPSRARVAVDLLEVELVPTSVGHRAVVRIRDGRDRGDAPHARR